MRSEADLVHANQIEHVDGVISAMAQDPMETSMAFIFETLATPEQRAEPAQFGLESPFTAGAAVVREWLADRDRGLFFINLGGGNDRDYFLVLADRSGVLLRAEGKRRATGQFVPKGVDESWQINSISIPKALGNRAREIVDLFQEALQAYGSLGDAKIARSVTVTLSTPKLV